ncbi:hypothetical protein G6F40_016867 [Rhizopus arrhizus]|nr:hypothetical protein G6F40_016867 [Rhizopus arrhizus]
MLDDHGQLMAERRVVGHAVRDGGRQDVAMAVFVLQAFAVQRRAAGGAAQEEAARLHVARSPSQVADALEPEHRVLIAPASLMPSCRSWPSAASL